MLKKIFFKGLFSLALMVFISYPVFAQSPIERPNTISMCVDEWPPKISKDLPGDGPQIIAMREILGQLNIEIELHWAPWKRCLENVKRGIWDASPGWSFTEERNKYLQFSEAYSSSYHAFFYLQGSKFEWKDFQDLRGLRIGTTAGYSYGSDFSNAIDRQKLDIHEVTSDADNFEKLVLGRVDIIAVNISTGFAIAEKALTPVQFKEIQAHERPIGKTKHSHVVFTKNDRGKELVKAFNKGLVISQKTPSVHTSIF